MTTPAAPNRTEPRPACPARPAGDDVPPRVRDTPGRTGPAESGEPWRVEPQEWAYARVPGNAAFFSGPR